MKEATISAIRFGYGLGPRPQPANATEILAGLTAPDLVARRFPGVAMAEARVLLQQEVQSARAERKGKPGAEKTNSDLRRKISREQVATERRVFARILETQSPFRERLTMFWLDHFSTKATTLGTRLLGADFMDAAIRENLTGRFSDMLRAAVLHPQMLLYLDQVSSVGPNSKVGLGQGKGLNENLAREVLELHTLGVGGTYTQTDVREFAKLLTGLFFRVKDELSFRRGAAEPGAEQILGRRYGGETARPEDIHAFLDDLSVHPDTARHLSIKLIVHFVSDHPDPDHVAHVEQAWNRSEGDLMAVYAALLSHPAAWTPVGAKVKQPLDFIASAMLALGITGPEAMAMKIWNPVVRAPLQIMGQPFMRPPGPDGWPEAAAAWISPAGLATRIRWANTAPHQLAAEPADPRAFVRLALDDAASQRLIWAVSAAQTVAEGIGLVLASPEFNRR